MGFTYQFLLFYVLFVVGGALLCSGQFLNNKPWPTYSLSNMPQTSFSCQDKILGGYYADSETQCQMFHVCVKVAGVGIQDFRFLCPNGTAFDQEAQICADWGDVDCESSTLYYSSDNFDLYRLGSGFESKRAPYADEEEATFHLQRAETAHSRNNAQTIVNQSVRPEKPFHTPPSNYRGTAIIKSIQKRPIQSTTTASTTTTTTTTTTTQNYQYNDKYVSTAATPVITEVQSSLNTNNSFYNNNNNNNNNDFLNYYNQVTSTKTFSKATTPAYKPTVPTISNQQKQHNTNNFNDEIFRGSYSSNFFNNRNNGKEDFYDEYQQQNQTVSTTSAPSTTTTVRSQYRTRGRGRGSVRAHNINNIPTQTKTTLQSYSAIPSTTKTPVTPITSRHQQQSYQSSDVPILTQPASSTFAPFQRIQRINNKNSQYNNFQSPITSSTTPVVTQPPSTTTTTQSSFIFPKQQFPKLPSIYNNPLTPHADDFIKVQPQNIPEKEFYDVFKIPAKTNQQYNYNYDNYNQQLKNSSKQETENYNQTPQENHSLNKYNTAQNYDIPSSIGNIQKTNSNNNQFVQQPQYTTAAPTSTQQQPQQTIPSRSNFKYNQNYQQINRQSENYTPSTVKKFSTLVPRDQYDPTTFKPTTYKKPIENLGTNKYSAASYLPTKSTTTTSTTQSPSLFAIKNNSQDAGDDGDDGQYHPELYEKDFVRNKLKQKATKNGYAQRVSFNSLPPATSTTTQRPTSIYVNSGEDEFLKTAHSQNIAASGNELRAEKARQSSPRPFSKAPTIPPNATTTKKTIQKDKDTSYDYAYYDTFSEDVPHEYSEYDIADFGKTLKKQKY